MECNLVRADEPSDDVFFEDLCSDAQQATEKALKALCMHRSLKFPCVHDLSTLITLLQQEGETIPDEVQEAGRLTRYAVETRYPGLSEPVTEDEHEKAVTLAEQTHQQSFEDFEQAVLRGDEDVGQWDDPDSRQKAYRKV